MSVPWYLLVFFYIRRRRFFFLFSVLSCVRNRNWVNVLRSEKWWWWFSSTKKWEILYLIRNSIWREIPEAYRQIHVQCHHHQLIVVAINFGFGLLLPHSLVTCILLRFLAYFASFSSVCFACFGVIVKPPVSISSSVLCRWSVQNRWLSCFSKAFISCISVTVGAICSLTCELCLGLLFFFSLTCELCLGLCSFGYHVFWYHVCPFWSRIFSFWDWFRSFWDLIVYAFFFLRFFPNTCAESFFKLRLILLT
jgi:hypothetical protein